MRRAITIRVMRDPRKTIALAAAFLRIGAEAAAVVLSGEHRADLHTPPATHG